MNNLYRDWRKSGVSAGTFYRDVVVLKRGIRQPFTFLDKLKTVKEKTRRY